MRTAATRRETLQQLLAFRTCPTCEYSLATDEGRRACHYGACPNLPEDLDTRCPKCFYNFFTDDLEPACGDPPTCAFARDEAPLRVEALTYWLQHQPRPGDDRELAALDPVTAPQAGHGPDP